ncbi:MAG: Sodium/hydrogen exchanger [Phycisphaerales bacterium]|nr:Sodium/hydrogen exchanger [Phycisphaerales bacterium]
MTVVSPLALLLLQIAIILAASRLMGALFAKMRQPQVIGEIIAGLLLGPSLFGAIWPGASAVLFGDKSSLNTLNMLAQIGVLLFLFLVGLEFDPKIIRQRGKTAVAISISGIFVPFVLGFGITYPLKFLFDATHQAHLFPTALFMGAAMSVTAFPVLARIVTERNLQRTDEGGLAIAAAAIDDVLAWTMLAVVVAFVPAADSAHNLHPAAVIGLAILYVAVMWFLVRPFLKRVQAVVMRQDEVSTGTLAVLLLTMLLSAYATETIGVHALFGAFVAGLVMPKTGKFVEEVTLRIESFVVVFMLPLFFAFAGLKVDLRKLFHPDMLAYTALLTAIACLGKLGGASIAAYMTGLGKRKSLTLGVLMNTRGLMELIILTVGLQLKVINETVYGMMIIMALVTTGMAAPLIELLLPRIAKKKEDKIYSVLIPIAKPDSGGPLMQMAGYLTEVDKDHRRLCAIHLARPTDSQMFASFAGDVLEPKLLEEMAPLLAEAESNAMTVEPMAHFSRDVPSDIARTVHQQNIDLVLMGYHTPVWGRSLLGGIVHRVMTAADCDVAVFVDRNFDKPTRILVPFMGSSHDKLALDMAGRIARATGAAISIIHVTDSGNTAQPTIDKAFTDPTQKAAVNIKVVPSDTPADAILSEITDHDLVVIGVAEEWGLESSLIGIRAERIATDCPASMLIVRRYGRSG